MGGSTSTIECSTSASKALQAPERLLGLLKHRYPFLLIDRIVEADGKLVVARKNLSFGEAVFRGHFPDEPVMPETLILEGMAQVGCVFVGLRDGGARTIFLAAVERASFKRRPVPGDVLTYECRDAGQRANRGKFDCRLLVEGEVLAEATAVWFAPSACRGFTAASSSPSAGNSDEKGRALADMERLLDLLDHRHPMLMVDRLVEFRGDGLKARKCVSFGEEVFLGHFPERPVMPGLLMLEGMAQTARAFLGLKGVEAGRLALSGVRKARFRRPATPGDVLTYNCERAEGERTFRCRTSDEAGELVASAEIEFAPAA